MPTNQSVLDGFKLIYRYLQYFPSSRGLNWEVSLFLIHTHRLFTRPAPCTPPPSRPRPKASYTAGWFRATVGCRTSSPSTRRPDARTVCVLFCFGVEGIGSLCVCVSTPGQRVSFDHPNQAGACGLLVLPHAMKLWTRRGSRD